MSTSEVLPCASKHGAIRYTTGPEPAGGSARGGGTGCPQIVAAGGGGRRRWAAGQCCWAPAQPPPTAASQAATILTRNRLNMQRFPDSRARGAAKLFTLLDFRRRREPTAGTQDDRVAMAREFEYRSDADPSEPGFLGRTQATQVRFRRR